MRKVSIFLLLLLLPASTLLAQDWRDRHGREYARGDNQMELTPFGGYRYGGTIFADTTDLFSQNVDVKSSPNYGVNFSFPVNPYGMKIELLVDRQDTNFTHGGGLFSPSGNLGDFRVTYFQGGLLFPFSQSRSATPFVAVSAGVANLDPDISGVSASNRFSASAAIGVKVPVNRNLSLRIEERGYFTSMDTTQDRCRSCYYNYNHDLYQGETNFGIAFKF